MASFSCSFAAHSQKNCDISKRYPGVKDFFPLTSCKKDIMSHLRTIKVGQTKLSTEKRFNSCSYWSFPWGWSQHDNMSSTPCRTWNMLAKKQDQFPKLLLTIQFLRIPNDGPWKHRGEHSASLKKWKHIWGESSWKAKRLGIKLVLQLCVAG